MTARALVVVPTYRRPDLLARCLDALVAQRFDGGYEVIVADDAASDETRAQVNAQAERFVANGACLRYLAILGNHGPAAARNAGWRAARGDVIAFTDDDCLPQPEWLAAGVRAIEDGADAVTGRVVVPLESTPPTDFERETRRLAEGEFVTANCFCRRTALETIGGFDERFTAAWREDSDLHFNLLRGSYRLVHQPMAVIVHPVRTAPWGASIRQQRKSQFNALLYKKHPQLYRQRIQRRPPMQYYVAIGSLAVMAAGSAARHRPVALTGAALWGVATARFCRKRLAGTSRRPAHVAEMIVTSAAIPPLSIYWRLRGAFRYRVPFV